MAQTFGSRLKRAWNAFTNRDPPGKSSYGGGYSYRPDRVRLNRGNDRTILTAIYTRIATDAASITINHVRLDENGRYDETVDSGLNSCLNLSGNKDQTGRALRYDLFLSVLDEGAVALVKQRRQVFRFHFGRISFGSSFSIRIMASDSSSGYSRCFIPDSRAWKGRRGRRRNNRIHPRKL